ncbi:2-dehydro-3-deoxygalactonokinase [Yoonia sp. 208BN28-4]|uniref:2-dehydro-3-deoxygalactonokinase n=1 Tax=Yoonia sp. 208BN28-4 TaxID=3126505 RepID=UPI0030A2107C
MSADIKPDWIAADWGTSNLRVWAMTESGTVLAQAASNAGMASLTRDGFEPALRNIAGQWMDGPTTVVACGMVGARQGWVEAPYATVPCPPVAEGFAKAVTADANLQVHVIPGLRQLTPPDVMRGEETQIAGFLARNPNWDGILCLPGTHTKWVHISADEVVSFKTFMTGELFATISNETVLRHSIGDDGWDQTAFDDALSDAMSRPERLTSDLFALRAAHLLHDQTLATARARLSGLLIGCELAGTKPYWLGQQVAVIGASKISSIYINALAAQGVPATQVQGDATTLAGLTAAYRRLKG